jgi:membrane-bound inhibitor of C-type lysozyme
LGILAACAVATACSPAPAPAPAPPAADEALDAGALFDLAMIRDYKCADGAMISVRFGHDPHDARVSADGGLPSILKPVLAASGARYEAAGMSLHTKGNEALWTDFGKAMTRCVEVVQ